MVYTLRNIVIVAMVILGAAVLFKRSDRQDERAVAERPRAADRLAAAAPAASRAAAARFSNQLVLEPGRNGHYFVVAEVEGVDVNFLVDTGASRVVLTMEDAERIGYYASDLQFSQVAQTANGRIRAAPLVLDRVSIGQLEVADVQASVTEASMGISLLGMTFLQKLDGFQVENGKLILSW